MVAIQKIAASVAASRVTHDRRWRRKEKDGAEAVPPTRRYSRGPGSARAGEGRRGGRPSNPQVFWRARLRPGLFNRASGGHAFRLGTANLPDRSPSPPAWDCAGRIPISQRSSPQLAIECPKNHVARDGRSGGRATLPPRAISKTLSNLPAMKAAMIPARKKDGDDQASVHNGRRARRVRIPRPCADGHWPPGRRAMIVGSRCKP